MAGSERDRALDERLRAALEPMPTTVRRVVGKALHPAAEGDGSAVGGRERATARRLLPGLAAAASLAAVATVLLLVLAPRLRPAPRSCLLVNQGAVFVVRGASGRAAIVGPDASRGAEGPQAEPSPRRSESLLFIAHGERR